MNDIAGWIAPAATMVAAIMTAANLGARVTGWGFVVFGVGSIAWIVVALGTGQTNLLWTNGFLSLVNLLGIWRWLGRQARYEEGGKSAAARSARAHAPTLIAFGAISGAKILDEAGDPVGVVVEAMMRCSDTALSYLVVSDGGVAGLGEKLYALAPGDIRLCGTGVVSLVSGQTLANRPPLEPTDWPASLAEARRAVSRDT